MPFARSFLRPFIEHASSKRTLNLNDQIGIAVTAIGDQSPFGESGNMQGLPE